MSTSNRTHAVRRVRAGFTLIEILVSIGVIVILMSLVITVGARVIGGQKVSQTTGILRTFDRALEEYFTDNESFPKYSLQAHRNIQGAGVTPADIELGHVNADIRGFTDGEDYPARPTVAVFIDQVRGFGAVDSIIESMPSQFMRSMKRPQMAEDQEGGYVRVADAWDREILYVHPDNALAQALYGTCTNRRPYFLSSGENMGFGFSVELPQDGMSGDAQLERINRLLDDNQASTPIGAPLRTQEFYDSYRAES